MPGIYTAARTALLSGTLDLRAVDLRALLIDSADETYNPADAFLPDVTSAGIVSGPVALANKTVASSGGVAVFDADDLAFTGVTGDSVEAVILYVHTGTASTSRLVSYHDMTSVTPNGGNVLIAWAAAGIIALNAA